ncbi:hypothetical protein LTR94_025273, partial [Friedmanniomyces endolithicus]
MARWNWQWRAGACRAAKRALFEAATKRADKMRAKGKQVDFDELLRMEPDGGTTNVRRTESRHWWPWLAPEHRCLVPFTSFNEPDQVNRTDSAWFALAEDRPLAFFAGVWTPHACVRKISKGWEEIEAFGFLTTDANAGGRSLPPQSHAGDFDHGRGVGCVDAGVLGGGQGASTPSAGRLADRHPARRQARAGGGSGLSDDDEAPLRPVVQFSAGVMDEAVALELVAAETVEQLLLLEGRTSRFVFTPDAAIEISQALIERGELAKRT